MRLKQWTERIVIYGLYAALVTPLVFYQAMMHPLIAPKTFFFQTLIEIVFALYLWLAWLRPEYRPRRTALFIAFTIFCIVLAITAAVGVHPLRSIWSTPERMTGLMLWAHLLAFFVMLSSMGEQMVWRRYFSFSLAVSFIAALFPVIQLIWPGIFFDAISGRLSGTIGNPIFLASYLLFHVFIGAWLARVYYREHRGWRMWFTVVATMFTIMVLLLTETRGALMGLIIGAFILSFYFFIRRDTAMRWRRVVIGVWIAVVAAGVAVVIVERTGGSWGEIPVLRRLTHSSLDITPRLRAWHSGLQAFRDKPFAGWGWENFYYALNTHYDPRLLRYGFGETFFDKPHNAFLEVLVASGVIGFAAYSALFGFALWQARRRAWLAGLLAAYLVQNFFAFDIISSYIILVVVLAYIDYTSHPPRFAGEASATRSPLYGQNISAGRAGWFIFVLVGAGITIYFVNYRVARAGLLEWQALNYFVQQYIPEGVEYFNKTLAASTPYKNYIRKDLAPNIGFMYNQNIALPDVKRIVARAVDEMKTAIASDPLHYGFRTGLADMMTHVYPFDPLYLDLAEEQLNEAEKLSPRRQATLYIRSKIRHLKGDVAGARDIMKQAVDLDPEVGDAHFFYALLLFDTGDIQGGATELERAEALGRGPRKVQEIRVVAAYLGDAGRLKDAIRFFQRALLLEPDDLETKVKLGLVYFFDGQRDAARRLISDVMKIEDLKKSPQYPALRPILNDLGLE